MNSAVAASGDLQERLERQIVKRTWGRVSDLRVETKKDQVVVHGSAGSYYVKQLALEAVLESLPERSSTPVSLNIEVGQPG